MLGEIDTRNTLPFLRASNTGHEGNLSTLHANTPKDAIKAIGINATLGGGLQNPDTKMLNSYIASGVDYIIQIKRIQNQRVITDILNLKEILKEIDINSIENRYLPSSNAVKAYYKCKAFMSFIWELNNPRWGRNPD